MKKIKLMCFAVIFIFIFAPMAFASNELPVYEDFNGKIFKEMPGWSKSSMAPKTDKHYVRVEDGKLLLSVGKVEASSGGGDVWPFFKLLKPAAKGIVTFEFTVNISENSCFASYHGLGGIYSSDNSTLTPTSQGIAIFGKNNMLFSTIQVSDKIPFGKDVRICRKINLSEGKQELYIDGEAITDQNGNSSFEYTGKDIDRVSFNISGSSAGDGRVYIDDVYIYTDEKMIFVSESGSDENDGTYSNPKKSIDAAAALYDSLKEQGIGSTIVLKSGKYALPNGYVYSRISAATASNHAIIVPMNDAEISIEGAPPFLNQSLLPDIKQEFKEAILKKTAEEYPKQIDVRGLELLGYTILESDTGISYTAEILNKSSLTQKAVMITAVYKNGKMRNVYADKLEFAPNSKSTKSAAHEINLDGLLEYKIFMLDSLMTITPFDGYSFDGVITRDVDIVNHSDNIISVKDEGTYRSAKMAVLDMEVLENAHIAVKIINNENNEIGYLGQITQSKGNLKLICAGSCLLGNSTIHIKGVSVK